MVPYISYSFKAAFATNTNSLYQVHQLQHELSKKDELLRMVASASEESETDSSCSTPLRHPTPAGAALALSQLEALQSKLQELEEENLSLRSEVCHGLCLIFQEQKGFTKA